MFSVLGIKGNPFFFFFLVIFCAVVLHKNLKFSFGYEGMRNEKHRNLGCHFGNFFQLLALIVCLRSAGGNRRQ